MISRERLRELLDGFPKVSIVVVGDFFLDKYLIIDRALSEVSLETGLEAYQVVDKRCSPGAAGTICNNLAALRVGTIYALTVIGDDGEGYELKKGLRERGVCIDYLIESPQRFTPTYTKPMIREDGREREIERQDIKNRTPLPPNLEREIIDKLRELLPQVDAVIIQDQVQERNCGVVTDGVRESIAELATSHFDKIFFADSRERIGEFRNVMIKPNRLEAARAIDPNWDGDVDIATAERFGRALLERTGKPVFLTMSEHGILVVTHDDVTHIPGIQVTGEIDIVGAGDSVTAGIVASLCSGATPVESAFIGNLVASITIQQIGTTGTASPEQVLEQFERHYG